MNDYCLDYLASALKNFSAPTGGFDPNEAWRHRYQIFQLFYAQRFLPAAPIGGLSLEGTHGPRGGATLAVD